MTRRPGMVTRLCAPHGTLTMRDVLVAVVDAEVVP